MRQESREVDLVQAIALGIAQAVVVATVIAVGAAPENGAPVSAYILAFFSGAVVVASYRLPVIALLAGIGVVILYYVMDLPPIGVAVPILGAVYLAALAGHIRAAAVGSTAFVALSAAIRVLEGGESSAVLAYDTVTNFALIAATVSLAAMQRAQRAMTMHQQHLMELERLAADRRLDVERLRISRELHDSLGHRLATVAVYAGVAGEARDENQRASALNHVQEATRSALQELRVAVRTIRSGFQHLPLPETEAAVGAAASTLREAGFEVGTSLGAGVAAVRPEVQLVAVRIMQEAVTNVLKHADAHRVRIDLSRPANDLVIKVQDDGHVDKFEAGGGIRGMHERARELGGTLRVGSGSDGFTVEARLPAGGTV